MNTRRSAFCAPPSLIRSVLRLGLILLAAVVAAPAAMAAAPGGADFDHVATGFALTGAHRDAKCESCHLNGVLKGTPKECSSCHGRGSRFQTTGGVRIFVCEAGGDLSTAAASLATNASRGG